MLKRNLLWLAFGPAVVLILLAALALGGHAAPANAAPASHLLACGNGPIPPCD